MPKGYWIARVDVRDAERYKDYVAGAKPAFEKYGARFLARGGAFQKLEGQVRAPQCGDRVSALQAALDCYNSPEYQAAAAVRHECAEAEMVVVEGI